MTVAPLLQSLDTLLVAGGDDRLALIGADRTNRYGYGPLPAPREVAFGSSTASTVSASAHAAAADLWQRLADSLRRETPQRVSAEEMRRLRARLLQTCGLDNVPGTELLLAASGTDIHLLLGQLLVANPGEKLLTITVEPSETGSGVSQAIVGRHFAPCTAGGTAVPKGSPLTSNCSIENAAIAIRDASGNLRDPDDIELEIERLLARAQHDGRRALLLATDVSKTGLIAPDCSTLMRLRRRWRDTLDVLIDACQWRISRRTLRAYVEAGFFVAITGSKFATGPAFSGALAIPPALGHRLQSVPPCPEVGAYSVRGDWPESWAHRDQMPWRSNFGLLLRWECALHEMSGFLALDPNDVRTNMRHFSDTIAQTIGQHRQLEAVPVRPLDRRAIGVSGDWDEIQTIFPFRLRQTPGGPFLPQASVERVYRQLASGTQSQGTPIRLGQPVPCGRENGEIQSALRLCYSARIAVEAAASENARGKILDAAVAALELAANLATVSNASAGIA